MPVRGNPIDWLTRLLLGLLLSLLLHGVVALPSLAQVPDAEPVFINGLFLFDVPAAGDLTALERALAIETNLMPLVESDEPVSVETEIRGAGDNGDPSQGGNPVIFAGDRYIMTVTNADVQVSGADSPPLLADRWANTISTALTQARAERQDGFLTRAMIKALSALAIAIVLHVLAGWLWQYWFKSLVDRFTLWSTEADDDDDNNAQPFRLFLRLTLFLVRTMVWLAALTYAANLFPITRRVSYQVMRSLRDGLFARSLLLGSRSYSLLDLLLVVAALLGLVIMASAATNLLRSRVLRVTGISLAAQEAISVLSKYTLILLGTVVILQLWGLDLSSIALIASGLGIGVGLGLQGLVKDFVSGLVLVFERPVQVGDFVDFGQVKGTVARIGSRSTEIRTLDQVSIIVPNSHFLDSEVTNWSHGNPVSRIRLPVGIAYSANPQAVKAALLEACKKNQEILSAPAPQVFFLGFGDNALNFQLLVWIAQPSRQLVIKSDLYFAIEASLRDHGIEIPFPQRDLHIRSGHLPIDLSPEAQQFLEGLTGNLNNHRKGSL
ncbi:mechanosensitive ion channel family protein [Nodosilinea sp. E11]|uniref:mechanosensitive ion channel family protein n=1 Tax=Nodosilinea sp. E11 TaxID=3037479 RepID=UPI002934236C|nr:mechanosensitive ion channel domain-containing protein [Nodosilinea sp. E11]WOD37455.1 mechanosensitive ion channel [Nodosilinea sp. E11]